MSLQVNEIVQVRNCGALMQQHRGEAGRDRVLVLSPPHALVPVFVG